MLAVSQVYVIIVLPNGGPDLEAYSFSQPAKTGWRQACSLFWQIVRALSTAEDLVSFEVHLFSRSLFTLVLNLLPTSTGIFTGAKFSLRISPQVCPLVRVRRLLAHGFLWTTWFMA